MEFIKKIHLTPEDYLTRIHECYDGKHNYIDYFIEPYGPLLQNEISDTVYEDPDCAICYHEHTKGSETFLVKRGHVEVTSLGKRTTVTCGDLIHTPAFTPHCFHWIEPGTMQREMFQETLMNEDMMANARHRVTHPETFDMMMNGKGNESLFYDYVPVTKEVPKDQLPLVRPFDKGIVEYNFEGCTMRLKVGRWETRGLKEVWQFILKPGFELSCNENISYYSLFDIHEGKVKVEIDGVDSFIANKWDMLHIPTHLSYRIKALEETVLFDFNCEGFLLRAMEEICSVQNNPETTDLEKAAEEILQKNGFMLRGKMHAD